MSITSDIDNNELVIHISGRFDFSLHRDFREAVERITPKVQQARIDLEKTEYVDSSALGMLLILRDKMGNEPGNIRITGVRPSVRKILEIANFEQLFKVA